MNKWEFTLNCPKKVAVDAVFNGIKNPVIATYSNGIYGKRSDNDDKFILFYALGYRNCFNSKFYAEVTQKDNKTYITGNWKVSYFAIGIIVFWYCVIGYNIIKDILTGEVPGVGIFLMLWFLVAMALGMSTVFVVSEKNARRKVYEHVKKVEREINGCMGQ